MGAFWQSEPVPLEDGADFLPVPPGSALPDGYFLPLPWHDGFITAGPAQEVPLAFSEDIRLRDSNSGRARLTAPCRHSAPGSSWQPVRTGSCSPVTTGPIVSALPTAVGWCSKSQAPSPTR